MGRRETWHDRRVASPGKSLGSRESGGRPEVHLGSGAGRRWGAGYQRALRSKLRALDLSWVVEKPLIS